MQVSPGGHVYGEFHEFSHPAPGSTRGVSVPARCSLTHTPHPAPGLTHMRGARPALRGPYALHLDNSQGHTTCGTPRTAVPLEQKVEEPPRPICAFAPSFALKRVLCARPTEMSLPSRARVHRHPARTQATGSPAASVPHGLGPTGRTHQQPGRLGKVSPRRRPWS